jgi:hypothetical protein
VTLTSQRDAVRILRDEHATVAELVNRLSRGRATAAGLGGGDWSPKDLLGHLTSWEEYALAAIGAWGEGLTAPIDVALRAQGLHAVNRDAVAMRAARPLARVRAEFDEVHGSLLEVIGAIAPDVWAAPPTRRARRSLGEKVGGILGGAGGGFHHAATHLPDLRAFVAER